MHYIYLQVVIVNNFCECKSCKLVVFKEEPQRVVQIHRLPLVNTLWHNLELLLWQPLYYLIIIMIVHMFNVVDTINHCIVIRAA